MKITIMGFSTGDYGRQDGPIYLLVAGGGDDIELRAGDEIEITVTRPTPVAADGACAHCGGEIVQEKPYCSKCRSVNPPRR